MIKKHLMVASMVFVSIFSCLVVVKYTIPVFAESNTLRTDVSENDVNYAYFVDDTEHDSVNEKTNNQIKKDYSVHELTSNANEDFDYSKVFFENHMLGDQDVEIPAFAPNPVINQLQENKGNSIPTNYWNLISNPYQYTITNMYNYVYTNHYFNASTEGKIRISFNSFNTGGNSITIKVYEVVTNNLVATWNGNPENIIATTVWNLSTDKLYYFKFETTNGPVNGSGVISHP